MNKIKSLYDLFISEIKDLYDAEGQLVKAIPAMVAAAEAPELKSAFSTHLAATKIHLTRLENILKAHNEPVKGKHCAAMEGLIKECTEMVKEDAEPTVRDAGLIACAQRVEHYEIAGYGCVRTFAKVLGFNECSEHLQKTLDEEIETDLALTDLATSLINIEAANTAQD
ncbi:MAG: ferritin-like domain-containing protein [Verrucomicrobiota bacterium]|nr:ferritin-like domain-containing protein [Verrucomicrobiota bacterium]